MGNVAAARASAESARQQDVHATDYRAAVVLGAVALRQRDGAATAAFKVAIERADEFLKRCDRLFDARDCRALALSGLALSEPLEASRYASEAAVAFRAARTVNRDPGVVARVLFELNAIAMGYDSATVLLADTRIAAAGNS